MIAILLVTFLSFGFIVQPYAEPTDFEGHVIISNETAHIVEFDDGTYALYMGETHIGKIYEEDLAIPPYDALPIINESESIKFNTRGD